MTSTDIPRESANPISFFIIIHKIVVITDITITTGTKMPDTLSAILDMGALVADVSLTIFIICEITVSSPTFVALQRRNPD